jgi:hypothetical protein
VTDDGPGPGAPPRRRSATAPLDDPGRPDRGWIVNLLVAEVLIRRGRAAKRLAPG